MWCFEQNRMSQSGQYSQFCVRQAIGDESIDSGVASRIIFACHYKCWRLDLVQESCHFRSGVNSKNRSEDIRVVC